MEPPNTQPASWWEQGEELHARGVKFLILRMRSPALTRHIASLQPADFKTVTLDRAGRFGQPAHPRVHEDPAATLTSYPGTVRQLIVTGLGHDTPTVIITNDRDATTRNRIRQYARRMTTGQRLAEIIRAFYADALSSTVNLNVDLDIMLAVLAPGPDRRAPRPAARLRRRHPRRHPAALPGNPGQITTTSDTITVRLERRAYSPVLRKASLPADTRVPWWGGRTLRYEYL